MTESGPHLELGQMLRKLAQRSCVVVAPPLQGCAGAAPLALLKDGQPAGTVVWADFERARRAGFIEEDEQGEMLASIGEGAGCRAPADVRSRAAGHHATA